MKMKITGNGNTQVYLKQLTIIDKIFEAIGQQEIKEINLSEYSEKQLIRARRKLTRERLKILFVAMTQRDITRLFIGYIIFMICLQLSGSTFSLTDSSAIWFFISVTAIFLLFIFWLNFLSAKVKLDTKAIDILFAQNWQRKELINAELQRRMHITFLQKCGIKDNILEYIDKE